MRIANRRSKISILFVLCSMLFVPCFFVLGQARVAREVNDASTLIEGLRKDEGEETPDREIPSISGKDIEKAEGETREPIEEGAPPPTGAFLNIIVISAFALGIIGAVWYGIHTSGRR